MFADTEYEASGYNLPNTGGSQISQLLGRYPPGANNLSDPNYELPGWPVITGTPQIGDLIAFNGHVGIVSGDKTTISASTDGVKENDWGFREGQKPTIRRCSCAQTGDDVVKEETVTGVK